MSATMEPNLPIMGCTKPRQRGAFLLVSTVDEMPRFCGAGPEAESTLAKAGEKPQTGCPKEATVPEAHSFFIW
jgi:hypothetical protein